MKLTLTAGFDSSDRSSRHVRRRPDHPQNRRNCDFCPVDPTPLSLALRVSHISRWSMAELDARSDVPHDKEESSSGDGLVSPLFSCSVTTNGDKQLVSLRGELDIASLPGLLDWLIEISGPTDDRRDIAAHLASPQKLPAVPNLEVTSRYVSGSDGVEIGGDWYSLVSIDDHRFGFVVGDVSGKGIGAATIMARLRFTIRAYLFEGHSPEVAVDDILPPVRYRHGRTHVNGAGGSRRQRIGSTGRGQRRPPGSVDHLGTNTRIPHHKARAAPGPGTQSLRERCSPPGPQRERCLPIPMA